MHRVDGDREAVDAVEQREARLHHRPEPVVDADDDHLAAFAVKFHLTETHAGTQWLKKKKRSAESLAYSGMATSTALYDFITISSIYALQ